MVFPRGACDAHMHFYDDSYPISPAALLRPPDATPEQYAVVQTQLGLDRAVVVQPTTYGLDNRCQLAGMATLGGRARGVVVVDQSATRSRLSELNDVGVCGVRFHMLPGGMLTWDQMPTIAAKVADFDWHVQLQLNGRDLSERAKELHDLPGQLVIDHVGRFTPPVGTNHRSFVALATLLDAGDTWVKLSAPYESKGDGPPSYDDVTVLVRELVRRWPQRCLWATNWPHPGQIHPPTVDNLERLLQHWIPDPGTQHQILVLNPEAVYGFDPATR
ncbi:MAG: amidohydrolase family protein [Acidimicrobiales bacterium]